MSDPKTAVRVRIAPSPTGDPHVGTAYIGLFNMVFARKHGGRFVLRIEDTDQTRSTRESEDAIYQSLRWVGLTWDEGPDKGGAYGPYRQSERTHLYREHVERLVAGGHAYRCFCTAERLAELREGQRREKLPTRYDGLCRGLAGDEVARKVADGLPYVVRLATPDEGKLVMHDVLRGEIEYDATQIDDQVLLKSDGFPTYHLANVVDDHLMEITHVIRAEEWIPSTPKHLLLYRAFGWEPPTFVHMPLLRNADKSKISKRKNPVSLEFFRKAGFLPEAMLNFLGMMGWSMPADQEKFTVDEMVEQFTWDRMSLAGPVFNIDKLEWLNGVYIRELDDRDLAARILAEVLTPELVARVVPLVKERMRRLDEFLPATQFFFTTEVSPTVEELMPKKGHDRKDTYVAVRDLGERLDALRTWSTEAIEGVVRGYVDEKPEWKVRDLFMTVRVVATGRAASPPLFETMEAMGKALCQDRFRRATATLRP